MAQSLKDLVVYKKSLALAMEIFHISKGFPIKLYDPESREIPEEAVCSSSAK